MQHSLTPRALLTLVPALVVSNVNYYNSVLAGVSVPFCTLSGQTAVHAKCCCSADLLGNEVRTHQPATAPTPMAVCSGQNSILVFHCLRGTALSYHANSLCHVTDIDSHHHLSSINTKSQVVPLTCCSTTVKCAFPVATTRSWNGLP